MKYNHFDGRFTVKVVTIGDNWCTIGAYDDKKEAEKRAKKVMVIRRNTVHLLCETKVEELGKPLKHFVWDGLTIVRKPIK